MSTTFNYTARRTDGVFVAGSLRDDSVDSALAHLRNRSLFVTSLERAGSARGSLAATLAWLRIDRSSYPLFLRSMATMLAVGVPLKKALTICENQCRDGRLQEALRSIVVNIDGGMTFSSALERRPQEFSGLEVAFVRSGELGGTLREVIERMATLTERGRSLRKRIVAALTYPAVVAVVAVALIVFLVSTIVPAFASMFAELHADLPPTTRALIAIGAAVRDPRAWSVTGVLLLVAAGFCYRVAAESRVRARFNSVVARLPVVGPIVSKGSQSRIARTLGALLRSGVPISEALAAARGVAGIGSYERGVDAVMASLAAGEGMAAAFMQSRILDPMALALIGVGEETGMVDGMLERIADYLDADVDASIERAASVIEPLLIGLLGVAVGSIVAAVLVPLYSVIGSIK